MKTSARNVLSGTVTALKEGPINAEVELTTAGGDRVVAIVTQASVRDLGLAIGGEAVALVKAPWVMVVTDDSGFRLSARNRLRGKVARLVRGPVNVEVAIGLPGGSEVVAVITAEGFAELGLREGDPATALFKASSVILGVPA